MGLSLLVVTLTTSRGAGPVAAGAVARHGDGDVRGGVILASPDARAQASSRIPEGSVAALLAVERGSCAH